MPASLDGMNDTRSSKRRMTLYRRGILVGAALLLLSLLGITFVMRREFNAQVSNQVEATHARQLLMAIDQSSFLLEESENSQRGYLLSGDQRFLDFYHRDAVQIQAEMETLAQLTADSPDLRSQLSSLKIKTQTQMDQLDRDLALYPSGRRKKADALPGELSRNNVLSLVEQMKTAVVSSEEARTQSLKKRTQRTAIFIVVTTFIKALFLATLAYFILLEIKHRENYLHEIERREEWYRVTLTSIGDAVICTDMEDRITFINPVAEELTGWTLLEASKRPIHEVFQRVNATTRETVASLKSDKVENNNAPCDCILIRRDGHPYDIEDSVAPIHDREGRPSGSVIVFRDVSAAKAFSEQIKYASQHDPLTGLPNRLLLMDCIGEAIRAAENDARQVAILFLDLDGFKHINDSLGHGTGDKLLQSIADRLRECVQAPDLVGRLGGDEFVVLLHEARGRKAIDAITKKVLQAVSKLHRIDPHELHLTASMGVSIYPDDSQDAETLIKNADTAMYLAKENGRQSCKYFRSSMKDRAVERQSIEEEMRLALDRGEFSLQYQPKIDIRSGTIVGAEALLRWTHPGRGSVAPSKFIPIAEETGLILPIGDWVLREACSQAGRWAEAGLELATLSVNVSAPQFRSRGFLDQLDLILDETGMDPAKLELEITESVLMQKVERAAVILQQLRDKGILVSIDDFGTGYSSLSYLQKLPIDTLKIDQSFVRRFKGNPDNAAIVIAVINMSRSLKLRVIAEGVENAEDLDFLITHGCDQAQGYYFSHPVPAPQFAELLRNQSDDPMTAYYRSSPATRMKSTIQ